MTSTQVCANTAFFSAQAHVPYRAAFSTRFADFGVNFYHMFVSDVIHESKLGVWKTTFAHLIRLAIERGADVVQQIDRRYILRNMQTARR